jgi:hypothetical protein
MYKLIFILSMVLIMIIISYKIYNSFIVSLEKQGQNLTLIINK